MHAGTRLDRGRAVVGDDHLVPLALQARAHGLGERRRRHEAVGGIAAVQHLRQQVAGAAADIEHAHARRRLRQARDQHLVEALLRNRGVGERQLEVGVPQPVVQVLDAEQLAREHQAEFFAVHGRVLYPDIRSSCRRRSSAPSPASLPTARWNAAQSPPCCANSRSKAGTHR